MSWPFVITDEPTDAPIDRDPRDIYLDPICDGKDEAMRLANYFMQSHCIDFSKYDDISSRNNHEFTFDGDNGGAHFIFSVKLLDNSKWKLDIRRVYRPEYDNVSGLNEDDNVSGLDEGEILSSKDVDIRQDSDQEHMGDMSTGPADLNSEEGLGPEGK
ncbi:hypothetical protein GGI03_003564 [Coemansia sp. RSA 2337]|nr:hypothetical protein LPJ71_001619 [Coemansia sp. S17]KAJ2062010.1 hypothetical protein GGI08_002749 [Coemansia sp. S2]KAJ2075989.1 hypothetical protein GGH13_000202 [Coemansia sp. S155-1]KAJ2108816.1 hypothetical protein GGI16_000979 [Coemansia sp. S142-1]KAJ2344453.1 hypothetical protein GGH92_004468 [Coemansia sp. RSA 2673]KAJ2463893.1 hypothetical protein GGI03_003564 [Coemansia sp. RSA 2337]